MLWFLEGCTFSWGPPRPLSTTRLSAHEYNKQQMIFKNAQMNSSLISLCLRAFVVYVCASVRAHVQELHLTLNFTYFTRIDVQFITFYQRSLSMAPFEACLGSCCAGEAGVPGENPPILPFDLVTACHHTCRHRESNPESHW